MRFPHQAIFPSLITAARLLAQFEAGVGGQIQRVRVRSKTLNNNGPATFEIRVNGLAVQSVVLAAGADVVTASDLTIPVAEGDEIAVWATIVPAGGIGARLTTTVHVDDLVVVAASSDALSLRGVPLLNAAPLDNQGQVYDAANNRYRPVSVLRAGDPTANVTSYEGKVVIPLNAAGSTPGEIKADTQVSLKRNATNPGARANFYSFRASGNINISHDGNAFDSFGTLFDATTGAVIATNDDGNGSGRFLLGNISVGATPRLMIFEFAQYGTTHFGTYTLTITGAVVAQSEIQGATAAGGELAGTYPNPTVAKLIGLALAAYVGVPASRMALGYDFLLNSLRLRNVILTQDDVINDIYNSFLAREPTLTELGNARTSFNTALASGHIAFVTALRNLILSVFNTAEYTGRARTNAQFVSDSYWASLGRASDATGQSQYESQLAGGTSRATVLAAIYTSAEFNTVRVPRIYAGNPAVAASAVALAGDVAGNAGANTIAKIQGRGVSIPLAGFLTEAFGGALSQAIWANYGTGAITAVANGRLEITNIPGSQYEEGGIETVGTFNFSEKQAQARVGLWADGNFVQLTFLLYINSTNFVRLRISNNSVESNAFVGGAERGFNNHGVSAMDTNFRVRFRHTAEAGGTLYCERSTDGITWAIMRSFAGIPVTAVKFRLGIYHWTSQTRTVGWDDFETTLPADDPLLLGQSLRWDGSNFTPQTPRAANPMIAAGDLIIGGPNGVEARRAKGNNGDILRVIEGFPVWESAVDVQVFNVAGIHTWTKPIGAKLVFAVCIGAGGPGGGGVGGAASSARSGGAGGGGGALIEKLMRASVLGNTVTVEVGAGGVGGAGGSSANGATGIAGGHSSFGPFLFAGGGGAGSGGVAGTAISGGGSGGSISSGGNGGTAASLGGLPRTAAGTSGIAHQGVSVAAGASEASSRSGEQGGGAGASVTAASTPITGGSSMRGGAGGGAGGGVTTSNSTLNGTAGGKSGSYASGGGATGGTFGVVGQSATEYNADGSTGDGGGGSGGGSSTVGGANGGNGGVGSGGGGGGGGTTVGGNGGNGGRGEVRIYSW